MGRKPKLTHHHQRQEAIARREAGDSLVDIGRSYAVSHSRSSPQITIPKRERFETGVFHRQNTPRSNVRLILFDGRWNRRQIHAHERG
jgi:hypothetical protein